MRIQSELAVTRTATTIPSFLSRPQTNKKEPASHKPLGKDRAVINNTRSGVFSLGSDFRQPGPKPEPARWAHRVTAIGEKGGLAECSSEMSYICCSGTRPVLPSCQVSRSTCRVRLLDICSGIVDDLARGEEEQGSRDSGDDHTHR